MRGWIVVTAGLLTLTALPVASASGPLPHVDGNCVWVFDFPDAGFAICTGAADCPGGLYTKTVTFTGTEERCAV